MRTSRPGSVKYFESAVAKGLFMPSPSSATVPAFEAKAISVSADSGSTRARPRVTARVPIDRVIEAENGLLRQASRMKSFSFLAPSSERCTRSMATLSSSTSRSLFSAASTGIR